MTKDLKGKMTVREEQAAIIITKWARKLLNMQKNTQMFQIGKKLDKPKVQLQKKKIHDQHGQGYEPENRVIDTKKRRQQVLKEQAQVIYNIIKGVEDSQDTEANKL